MSNQLAVTNTGNNFLAPATSLNIVLSTYQAKKEFIEAVLKDGVDYGKIPGTGDKPALLKPGAEKMVSFFGLSPVFEDVQTIEDWTGADHSGEPFFYYRQKCKLYSGERLIATADGSCNSWEKKYRYRNSERVCPTCGKPSLLKSKDKPEFFCWTKRGGCGATFPMNDKRITEQVIGQVKNPDVAELVNTILKMSQKRALVAVTLIATNASDYFTQDIEDYASQDVVDAVFAPVVVSTPAPAPTPKTTNGNGHAVIDATPEAAILPASFHIKRDLNNPDAKPEIIQAAPIPGEWPADFLQEMVTLYKAQHKNQIINALKMSTLTSDTDVRIAREWMRFYRDERDNKNKTTTEAATAANEAIGAFTEKLIASVRAKFAAN